jgi:hypothetical protein
MVSAIEYLHGIGIVHRDLKARKPASAHAPTHARARARAHARTHARTEDRP